MLLAVFLCLPGVTERIFGCSLLVLEQHLHTAQMAILIIKQQELNCLNFFNIFSTFQLTNLQAVILSGASLLLAGPVVKLFLIQRTEVNTKVGQATALRGVESLSTGSTTHGQRWSTMGLLSAGSSRKLLC